MVMFKKFKNVAICFVAALLVACGGGGGGGGGTIGAVFTTNAGSAAIGAAMSNASISIQSLPVTPSTEILLTANAVGAFTVPTSVTFPALVKATTANGQYTYYVTSSLQIRSAFQLTLSPQFY